MTFNLLVACARSEREGGCAERERLLQWKIQQV